MSNFIKHQKFILAFLVLSLSACITLPGHRVTIDEIDFYLSVKAPNKKIKKFIRFNSEKTKIIYMPENVRIELLVTDKIGKRKLTIEKPGETIVYVYELNGRKVDFGVEEQQWFATQVPKIITKAGLSNV